VTLCLLVRHATHDLVDQVLVGRMAGVSLGSEGRRQAASLAQTASTLGVTCVQSSPRERALETAAPIARRLDLPVEICPELDELDFGHWTGRSFMELSSDPDWCLWNAQRGRMRAPGGESMAEAQARIIRHLQTVSEVGPYGPIIMVTHAEIIRAALLHCMSLPLGAWHQIEVEPASITLVQMGFGGHTSFNFGGEAAE